MPDKTTDQLVQDILDRVAAMQGAALTEEGVRGMIREHLDALAGDPEFVRKFKFAPENQPDPRLEGSKFGRWGLGLSDIEFLYDIQVGLSGQRRVSDGGFYNGPSEELEGAFKNISKALYLPQEKVRDMDKRAIDDLFPRIPLAWFDNEDQQIIRTGGRSKRGWKAYQDTEAYQRSQRAMDTAESGYGQQLVGAEYVSTLWEAARRDSRVFALLDTFEMTAPTAYLPVEADIPELLFVPENISSNAADYDTSKTGSNRVQVDAKKFVIHQVWSGEMEEDSLIPFIPFIRAQAVKSISHYSDALVLNGDTTGSATGNINSDDGAPASTRYYLAFDGIRHLWLVDNTNNEVNQAGAITFDALLNLRGKMVDTVNLMDWGHPTDPTDLIYIAEIDTADRIALLDEVITLDKFGPMATVFTGQLGRIGPHPLIASIAMSKTEADGKVSVTASNNTLGQVNAFNKRGFKAGWRRRVKTEVERLPGRDQTRLVHSLRVGFGRYSPTGAASGLECAAGIRNISL